MSRKAFALMVMIFMLLNVSCRFDWCKSKTEVSSKCSQIYSNCSQPHSAAQKMSLKLAHISAPQLPEAPGKLPSVPSTRSLCINHFCFMGEYVLILSVNNRLLFFCSMCQRIAASFINVPSPNRPKSSILWMREMTALKGKCREYQL